MTTEYLSFAEIKHKLKVNRAEKLRLIKKHKVHYLFMAPYALLFFIFTILPVAVAILLSFTSFNMLEMPTFIGISNYYKMLMNDEIFITAVKNTMTMAVIIGPGGYILSFLFAWLINELSRLMRVVFTIIFYAPSLAGGMLTIWTFFFSGDATGYVNGTLMKLGITHEPIVFFQNTAYMIPLIIVVSLWMSLGTTFLSFIAGFQGVDKQYYEAAAIDGIRNRWQELWYITLPLLKPQLFFGAVMSITSAFSVGDVVTALCGTPSTNYAAHTVMNHILDYGSTRYEMGYACALATVLFVIMLVSNILVQKLIRHVGT